MLLPVPLSVRQEGVTRLFVGGVPAGVEAAALGARLGKAKGVVVEHVDVVNGFAYVNVRGEPFGGAVAALVATFNNTKWRGSRLRVQVAREHYLAKLHREKRESELTPAGRKVARRARERMLAKLQRIGSKPRPGDSEGEEDAPPEWLMEDTPRVAPGVLAAVAHAKDVPDWLQGDASDAPSGDDSDSSSGTDVPPPRPAMAKVKAAAAAAAAVVSSAPSWLMGDAFEDTAPPRRAPPVVDEEAASGEDAAGVDHHLEFDSEGEAVEAAPPAAVPLFSDSGSESEEEVEGVDEFRVRRQFEGEKGQELLAIQKRAADSRFRMDERFADSDEGDGDGEGDGNGGDEAQGEDEDEDDVAKQLAEEQARSLAILDSLFDTGPPAPPSAPKTPAPMRVTSAAASAPAGGRKRQAAGFAPLSATRRYDPTRDDAALFELTPVERPKKKQAVAAPPKPVEAPRLPPPPAAVLAAPVFTVAVPSWQGMLQSAAAAGDTGFKLLGDGGDSAPEPAVPVSLLAGLAVTPISKPRFGGGAPKPKAKSPASTAPLPEESPTPTTSAAERFFSTGTKDEDPSAWKARRQRFAADFKRKLKTSSKTNLRGRRGRR